MRRFLAAFVRSACLSALAAAILPSVASAQVIGVHVASQHIPYKQRYNNLNPGLYYRTPEGWVGGFYLNSLTRTSLYVGRTLEHGKFAVTLAAVSGYTHPVQALVVPSVEVGEVAGARVRLAYIPRVEKRIGSHVLHLMVEY
jgi:hypothetical protein